MSSESILRRVRQGLSRDDTKPKNDPTGMDQYSGSVQSFPQDCAESMSDMPEINLQNSATSNIQRYSGRTLSLREKAKTLYHRKRSDFANRLRKSSSSYSDDQLTDLGDPSSYGEGVTQTPSRAPRDGAELPSPPVSPYAESAWRSPGSGTESPSTEPKNKLMRPAHRLQRRLTRSGGELMRLKDKRRDSTPPSSENSPPPSPTSPTIPSQRSRDLRPMSMRYKGSEIPQPKRSRLAESPELASDPPSRGRQPPLAGRRLSTSTLNKTPSLGFSFEPDYNRVAPPPTNLRKRRSRSDPRDGRRRSRIEE